MNEPFGATDFFADDERAMGKRAGRHIFNIGC